MVIIVFDPGIIRLEALLKLFWESHDPTQGMRQGNDRGTQYRSVIYTTSHEQSEKARESMAQYQTALNESGRGSITTEIVDAPAFYYAEPYHQQYLAKNPQGYCGIGGLESACLPHCMDKFNCVSLTVVNSYKAKVTGQKTGQPRSEESCPDATV